MLLVAYFQKEHLSVLPDFEPAALTRSQEFPLPINEVRLSFLLSYHHNFHEQLDLHWISGDVSIMAHVTLVFR